jgi:hypothetical protein
MDDFRLSRHQLIELFGLIKAEMTEEYQEA